MRKGLLLPVVLGACGAGALVVACTKSSSEPQATSAVQLVTKCIADPNSAGIVELYVQAATCSPSVTVTLADGTGASRSVDIPPGDSGNLYHTLRPLFGYADWKEGHVAVDGCGSQRLLTADSLVLGCLGTPDGGPGPSDTGVDANETIPEAGSETASDSGGACPTITLINKTGSFPYLHFDMSPGQGGATADNVDTDFSSIHAAGTFPVTMPLTMAGCTSQACITGAIDPGPSAGTYLIGTSGTVTCTGSVDAGTMACAFTGVTLQEYAPVQSEAGPPHNAVVPGGKCLTASGS